MVQARSGLLWVDVYDYVTNIADRNQALRERSDNPLASYFASVSPRQNETMKTLAAVGSVFLPLTLIAGIYGMNFEHMPELGWPWMYFVVSGFIGGALALTGRMFLGRRYLSRRCLGGSADRPVRLSLRVISSGSRRRYRNLSRITTR